MRLGFSRAAKAASEASFCLGSVMVFLQTLFDFFDTLVHFFAKLIHPKPKDFPAEGFHLVVAPKVIAFAVARRRFVVGFPIHFNAADV